MDNGRAIGYCGLTNISTINGSDEYFILIGDRQYWNKGIGTRAGDYTLDFAFRKLGLHRVWLSVSERNVAAIRCYQKIGFRIEGRMREACRRNGEWHDKVIMAILEQEWPNKSLKPSPLRVAFQSPGSGQEFADWGCWRPWYPSPLSS